jgi:hypothetical protein
MSVNGGWKIGLGVAGLVVTITLTVVTTMWATAKEGFRDRLGVEHRVTAIESGVDNIAGDTKDWRARHEREVALIVAGFEVRMLSLENEVTALRTDVTELTITLGKEGPLQKKLDRLLDRD